MRKLYCAVFITILLAACSGSKFTVSNFKEKTTQHKKIAVLPFRVIYTGKVPETIKPTDVFTLEFAEGKAFQKSLYNDLLNQLGEGKNSIKIDIQPTDKTNKLLQQSGVDYLRLDSASPNVLCKELGVDAVVLSVVEKEHFLTNLEPFGVVLTKGLLNRLYGEKTDLNDDLPQIPGNAARTYSIKSASQLKNGADGVLLWKNTLEISTKWKSPASTVIPQITNRHSKNFPYRNR
jgi:hypothetical protein